MRNRIDAVCVAIILLASASGALAQTSSRNPKLTIEQLIDIKHPSDPIWSPDGKLVAFVWDRAGVANLYIANADGSGQPKPLTTFSEGQVGGAFWSEIVISCTFRTTAISRKSLPPAALRKRSGASRIRAAATSYRLMVSELLSSAAIARRPETRLTLAI